jgi:CheY-like chemotaxis protein
MTPHHPRILVVEDDPLLRMAAVDMIEDAGFDSYSAAGALEAIELLQSHRDIRIVFTDIHMPPGMDGMALADCIRDRWPPIRIVLTSGHYSPSRERLPPDCLFFAKPYKEKEIVAALRKMAA